jgi:hypothetical protein
MNRGITVGVSVALLVVGIVLVIWGLNSSDSFSDHWSRFWTGSHSDKTIWLIVGGIVSGCIGLGGLIFGLRGGNN